MPLQKSFSDQNHSNKARVSTTNVNYGHMCANHHLQQEHNRQWGRNKSFQGQQTSRHNQTSKLLQEKPSIPVSTATKNKLSNFLAKESNSENGGKEVISLLSSDDKENSLGGSRKQRNKTQVVEQNTEKMVPPTDKKAICPSTPASRLVLPDLNKAICPSTPASRLALPDLIGMSDVERLVETISPDERVEWDHSKDESSQETTPFQVVRRANKRARSSSPVASSPAYGKGEHQQLDPGSELWGRYSLNGPNAATPLRPSVPALAHLMQTSSPQPLREGTAPRGLSSFRRANSCGTTFPKRRRIGGADGDVFTEPANIGPSRLSVLIERVQECMSQQKPHIPPNESCSPLHAGHRDALFAVGQAFPTFEPQQYAQVPDAMPIAEIDRQERRASVQANSSDYGEFDDDELDISVLDALDSQPAAQTFLGARTAEPLSAAVIQHPSRSPGKVAVPIHEDEESVGTVKADDDDEFGDFDDEVFEDLENVVSQFDTRAPVKVPDKMLYSLPPAGEIVQKADSDDEFGDDGIDENDFEAAVAATQSLQKTNDLLPVRKRDS
jgi:hypothetical protein